LEDYFKKVGHVIDVAVMRDKNSGRSRGFAFVTFMVEDFNTDDST
jgi:RNA recognition motif-containing protein